MTEQSAHRRAQHTRFTTDLRSLLAWLDSDPMIPVPEHLPIVVGADSPAALADLAIGHNLDGPYTADDGSVFLHRRFGTVSWQAVHYSHPAGQSDDERHARTWAAQHGCVIVPLATLIGGATP